MTAIESHIKFEQLGLGSILKHYQLSVPSNQREYSWTDKEVTTLLQDFSQAISEEENGYFLGTIVTIPKSGTLEVIDGQQRLATTSILLKCIHDYLMPIDEDLAASVNTDFLVGYNRPSKQFIPKLSLNLRDNDFFRGKITGKIVSEPNGFSHTLIEEAFVRCIEHINNVVASYAEKDRAGVLEKWVTFIEHNAFVVLVQVTDEANAYKMFEILNARGLKASQSDLVKNHLFWKAGDRIAEAQEKWAMLRGTLESFEDYDTNITIDFLRHALIASHSFVREQQVYETVQTIAKSPQSAITFTSNIENLANIYVATFNSEHEKWNKYGDSVRRSIDVLNMFDFKPMRPLILAIAAKFNEKDTQEAFRYLISLTVRIFISGNSRSGAIEQAFATSAKDIYSGKLNFDLKAGLKSITPFDEQFRSAFEDAIVSKMQWARYYLRSLEMVAKNESEPWLIPNDDRQAINLEHVLPKKPEGNWPEFNEEEVRLYVNRIGNLALLQASKNSDLRSEGFDIKKEVYQSSPYALTKQISQAEIWNKQSIIDRQKTLADYALIAWNL
jgi:Protein of unknown function DUF262/Protein of unknown function (DUF1524)